MYFYYFCEKKTREDFELKIWFGAFSRCLLSLRWIHWLYLLKYIFNNNLCTWESEPNLWKYCKAIDIAIIVLWESTLTKYFILTKTSLIYKRKEYISNLFKYGLILSFEKCIFYRFLNLKPNKWFNIYVCVRVRVCYILYVKIACANLSK